MSYRLKHINLEKIFNSNIIYFVDDFYGFK